MFWGGTWVVVGYMINLSFSRIRMAPAVTISVLSSVGFVRAYCASSFFCKSGAWAELRGTAARLKIIIAATVQDLTIALSELIGLSPQIRKMSLVAEPIAA